MYSHCLFCAADLGHNEMLEAFPVGRRLAFDAATGRLWVVCRHCARWNLTPLEERWEAIEAAERLYSATRLRVSTDNIGLARLGDGTELVRVGKPARPEMAAWRYGDQFGRRRRRYFAVMGATTAAAIAVTWGGPAAGLYTSGVVSALNLAYQGAVQYWVRVRPVVRVPGADGALLPLTPVLAARTELVRDDSGGWALDVPRPAPRQARVRRPWGMPAVQHFVRFTGHEALRAAGLILPHLNMHGGRAGEVRDAVSLIADRGTVEATFRAALASPRKPRRGGSRDTITALPVPVRLALEMAAHEETERRALEGELAELEEAWRAAEEIAAIADDLLLPERVRQWLRRAK